MKRMKDPFPPTPERFHRRVEATLQSLEEKDMNHKKFYGRTAVLVAAIVAALLAATAVAAVVGNSHFKDRLNAEGAAEVAELVQEAHLVSDGAKNGDFAFSIDEIIWEDHDLYISYSMAVPEDGNYMVAMYTPTLNGDKLIYDAKGFTLPKFLDQEDAYATVLLLGGQHDRTCNELWTFAVDPRLKRRTDNRLTFRAVLLKTDMDIGGGGDWTDMLNPPDCIQFMKDWRDWASPEDIDRLGADYAIVADAMAEALGDDGMLTVGDLIATGHAEYVTEREISMGLDGTRMEEALYNDLAEHDFDRFGMRIHVNRFRMTHLGVEIDITYYKPGAKEADNDAIKALNEFDDRSNWRFCTVDGKSLGYSLGGSGGGAWDPLQDGTPAYECILKESVILPLKGLEQIAFAPCEYVDDGDGGNHPVYDMENAIVLTPVFSETIAEMELNATPEPTLSPEEEAAFLSN